MNMSNKKNECFIIAEAGSNWKCGSYEDDLIQAKKLIQVAANSGANAIKFQTYKSQTIYVENAGVCEYLSETNSNENINDLFEYLSMPHEMIPELAKSCNEKNIHFMSTPFSVEDAKAVEPFVKIHKIASFEINHVRLLEFLAKTGKPIILSTGASTFDDIDFAVEYLKNNGCRNITLLQCTSKYPCPTESLNLHTIPEIRKKYNLPVGFSDHSEDPILAPSVAVGLGATVIEKHFTLDKNLPGPDHKFALNPLELKLMIETIRNVEKTFGNGKKIILDSEKKLHQFATRSIQAIKDIQIGDQLIEGYNFDVLRPGNRKRGLPGRYIEKINKKTSTEEVKKGDGILNFK